ncbi:unnamed protein product [Paramecium sonneborni]|uniref:Uncharacterized protein n=1 Tax=Paramecium sonneborni TaxID=65129 RepID=A0A8S1RQG5_9CILI|nr:unnamed protein product [Paramecium sonneborni]
MSISMKLFQVIYIQIRQLIFIFNLLRLLINSKNKPIFNLYLQQNQNIYLQQIHQVIQNVNILKESNKEIMDEILNGNQSQFSKPLLIFRFKLPCEVLISFDKLEIKNQFQNQILELVKTKRNRKLNDKQFQQVVSKYLQRKEIINNNFFRYNIIISKKKARRYIIIDRSHILYYQIFCWQL